MGKPLEGMSTEELGKLFPISLQPYDDSWPAMYREETGYILRQLNHPDIRTFHIGSTAIPEIMAKPCIDIILEIPESYSLEKIREFFTSSGYQLNYQPGKTAPHLTFVKGYSQEGFQRQCYHVHVRYPEPHREIIFRDNMLRSPELAREYEKLKLELAQLYKYNREKYTNAKSDFINQYSSVA